MQNFQGVAVMEIAKTHLDHLNVFVIVDIKHCLVNRDALILMNVGKSEASVKMVFAQIQLEVQPAGVMRDSKEMVILVQVRFHLYCIRYWSEAEVYFALSFSKNEELKKVEKLRSGRIRYSIEFYTGVGAALFVLSKE